MRLLSSITFLMLMFASPLFAQLQEPSQPINLIIDSDMAINVDDVGDHAMMWALANRGEVNVLALICSSANDYSCPTMRAIANYYNHPNVPIGAHKGGTPNVAGSNLSNYTYQITNQFGTPGDTRFNYPDAVTVYRQALASAPDNSVYIEANGYYQPLRDLLQSPPDSISPLTGVQLVAQKVRRLVSSAGRFPSGWTGNFQFDPDAASYVFANWPGEIVSSGDENADFVVTGPSPTSDPTQDPVKAAYNLYQQAQGRSSATSGGWGQVGLLFAVRGGIGTTFSVAGYNGQTVVSDSTQPQPGSNSWSQTPSVGHSYIRKLMSDADASALFNSFIQSSSNMPILRSISPAQLAAGSPGQPITLTGANFFSDSQVSINGSSRPTTFISGTQLSVQLSDSDLAQGMKQPLSVLNSAEGGWQSNIINLNVYATTPTLTSIAPSNAVTGSGPITLTVTGTSFINTSVIQVNGAARSTTFVSDTQLTTTLTGNDLASGGSLSITTATPGGGTSNALSFTVNNPLPSVSSLSQTSVIAGSAGFTLTLTGGNFVPNSVVQVNGANRTTTFVNATQLSAAIPDSDLAVGGYLSITVFNPAPSGGTSGAITLTVNNPLPLLSSISPNSVLVGSAGFTLTLTGGNFVSNSVVQVNGVSRTTTFVSATQLTAAISASDLAVTGYLSITVLNPAPSGGTSGPITLTVNNPLPSLSNISQTSALAGSAGFTLTLTGGNFVPNSVVKVNGASRPTTFVSATQLTAAIPASDMAVAGYLSITVFNPAPGGGTSGPITFTVNNPLPTISNISPNPVIAAGPSFTLTVNGSGFVSGSVVQFDGSPLQTTFVSATQLKALVPNTDIVKIGQHQITVFNSAPGGGASNSVTLTVITLLGQMVLNIGGQSALDVRPESFFSAVV